MKEKIPELGVMNFSGTWLRPLLNPTLWLFLILPTFLLFCLTFSGCDVQENSSVDLRSSSSPQTSVASPSRQQGQTIQQNGPAIRNVPRIVAFGDSLTAGLGVAPEEAYPSQLARLLHEQGFNYEVINAGVSGDTSAGGLRRVEWILKSHPKLVILELGANDGLRGQPLENTYDNLRAIIERLKGQGVLVILAGMQLPLNYGKDYTRRFSDLYARLAKEQQVAFIPFFLEDVAMKRHLNQADGLHPTAEGYSVVVKNVWNTLLPVLEGLDQRREHSTSPS